MADRGTPSLFPDLREDGEGNFTFDVTERWCVGPLERAFLFGGGALAIALAAIRRVSGREPVCATAQFVSYAGPGDQLTIKVGMTRSGGRLSQADASIGVGDRLVVRVVATLGGEDGLPIRRWVVPPDLPPPDECVAATPWPEQSGSFLERLDVRAAPDVNLSRPRKDGRLSLWLRLKEDRPVDVKTLALFGDFVPSAVGAALGIEGGGNSLDNTLRVAAIVPTRWVAAEARIQALGRGMAHGDIHLFAEEGTLMAIGSQSLLVRDFAKR